MFILSPVHVLITSTETGRSNAQQRLIVTIADTKHNNGHMKIAAGGRAVLLCWLVVAVAQGFALYPNLPQLPSSGTGMTRCLKTKLKLLFGLGFYMRTRAHEYATKHAKGTKKALTRAPTASYASWSIGDARTNSTRIQYVSWAVTPCQL